jgi:hypothetical protein
MANHWVVRTVLMAAGLGSAGAIEQMTATWDQLCPDTRRGELSVATRNGKTVKGTCESTSGSELTLRHSGKLVKIDRAEISRNRLRIPVKHYGFSGRIDDVGWKILSGADSLVPNALQPLGLIFVPIFVAYQLAIVPINAVHDLAHAIVNPKRSVEITLV